MYVCTSAAWGSSLATPIPYSYTTPTLCIALPCPLSAAFLHHSTPFCLLLLLLLLIVDCCCCCCAFVCVSVLFLLSPSLSPYLHITLLHTHTIVIQHTEVVHALHVSFCGCLLPPLRERERNREEEREKERRIERERGQ